MGLGLMVGILLDLEEEGADAKDIAPWEAQFDAINQALEVAGQPIHHEPAYPIEGLPWSCQMYGYPGLHFLRRIAAYIVADRSLPPPGDAHAPDDPVYQAYYARPAVLADDAPPQFTHLMQHSDCTGFYLPQPFRDVIVADEQLHVWGDAIGSAAALLDECLALAKLLEIPPDLDAESDEVDEAAERHGEGTARWERYGIESHACLRLMKACRLSIASGCALVFI